MSQNDVSRIIASIVSYLVPLGLFIQALLFPERAVDFLYHGAIAVFIAEFLSIHSAFMLADKQIKFTNKLTLVGVYSFFMTIFSAAIGTFIPAIVFICSLVAKLLVSRVKEQKRMPVTEVLVFMGTVFLVIPIGNFIGTPTDVATARPQDAGGLFGDNPLLIAIWGVLYFGLLIFLEVRSFLSKQIKH